MSNPWFRLYAEFSTDPKVQMLSEAMQRRYIMLMCMRCSNVTVTLCDEEIAFHLRISDAELSETKALFIKKGFVDVDWNLLNWEKRQFKSDHDISGAQRQKRFRDKQKRERNSLRNVTVTLPDTDTDTDTDTDGGSASATVPQSVTPPTVQQEELPKSNPSMAGAVCVALRSLGMASVSPSNPTLIDLIDKGADIGTFVEVGRDCVKAKKPFSYLLATVKGRMADASAIAGAAVEQKTPAARMLAGAI